MKNNELFTIKQSTTPRTDREKQSLLFEGAEQRTSHKRENESPASVCVRSVWPGDRKTTRGVLFKSQPQPREINHLPFENEHVHEPRFCCAACGRTSKVERTAWEAARGDEFCALAGENDKFGKLPPTEFVAAAHKQAGCLRAGTFCVCARVCCSRSERVMLFKQAAHTKQWSAGVP